MGRLIELVNQSVPDCLVENYEYLIQTLVLPDPKDRHVLAAAIVGHADAIVTANLRDFPQDVLAEFKATGKGWQTRMNAALRQFIVEHPLQG